MVPTAFFDLRGFFLLSLFYRTLQILQHRHKLYVPSVPVISISVMAANAFVRLNRLREQCKLPAKLLNIKHSNRVTQALHQSFSLPQSCAQSQLLTAFRGRVSIRISAFYVRIIQSMAFMLEHELKI